jgi:hypothetical protein
MENHDFDRLTVSLALWRSRANRRSLLGRGLIGGMLAPIFGVLPTVAAWSELPMVQGDCSLGCIESICGQVPPSCPIFPADNIWNTLIDSLPADAMSDAYIAGMGPDTGFHPDFGSGLYEGQPIGIPFVRVPSTQPGVVVTFDVADESDRGPYPIPTDAPIEGGACGTGDRHVIVVKEDTCQLYELYAATPQEDGSWQAYSGAHFDLASNVLRPDGWTSADAAGLPILPGLVRYEEIEAGVISHALRFTASQTQSAYVWPARHQASDLTDVNLPPLGQRFRLKADFDTSAFSQTNQIILQALKSYGMFLADNGSDWFFSGSPDERWDNDDLHQLQELVHGSDFEAVDSTSLMVDSESGGVALSA